MLLEIIIKTLPRLIFRQTNEFVFCISVILWRTKKLFHLQTEENKEGEKRPDYISLLSSSYTNVEQDSF